MAKLKSGTRIYGTATIDTSVVVGSAVTANSSGIQVTGLVTATSFRGDGSQLTGIAATTAGIATYATNAGIATYATNAGIATYATSAGVSTNVRGTANRVLYNSALDTTTTSANLTFDGTILGVGETAQIKRITPSLQNSFIAGTNAGVTISPGTSSNAGFNNIIGANAGVNISNGNSSDVGYNNIIGYGAGASIYVGNASGAGYNNIMGYGSGASITAGNSSSAGYNNIIGHQSGVTINTGNSSTIGYNNFIGFQVANVNTVSSAYHNVIGYQAGNKLSSGFGNNLFGYQAGFNVTSASYNVAIGYAAGVTNLTGSQNVVIGYNRDVPIAAGSNQLVIGSGSNDWIVGNSSYNVGIGTANPLYRFTVATSGATVTPSLSNVIADFTANTNTYSQINTRNASNGANASTDIIATADTGTDTTNYIDLGINNSAYSVAGWTINGALDGYLYTSDTNLSIGAAAANKYVSIFAGGTLAANEKLRVNTTGVGIGTTNPQYPLQVQGNARITGAVYDSTNSPGTSGQVLQSTVTGTQWTTAAGGGGGSGKFDTTIDNVLYVQPTGTLDIVGVGTTTTQITTLPSGSNKYIIHSMHVTNVSNGDAEVTAGFVMNARKVSASISVSIGFSGGPGIHTFSVGSASGIRVGMAVTGTGNIGETTGIGSTAGFQYNTYVTSVDGNNITLSKPMSGYATGTLFFSPVSLVSSRLPVPVGSAVELLKQPMVLNALDSIVLQSTGAGSGIGSTSTAAISQTANSNFLTVTAGAAITNFIAAGHLIQGTGSNTGIQTNTFVGVGYTPGTLSIPMTRPATSTLSSQSLSFTEVILPQDGALQVNVVYQSSTDTSYQNGTGIVTTSPSVYYATGNIYPSVIQSIRVANISDGFIYPGGDYPVSVGIGNSDTIFSWLAYNMVIPRNSSIELCEAPKRLGIGQSIFAFSNTPNAIEIQIAGKQRI